MKTLIIKELERLEDILLKKRYEYEMDVNTLIELSDIRTASAKLEEVNYMLGYVVSRKEEILADKDEPDEVEN